MTTMEGVRKVNSQSIQSKEPDEQGFPPQHHAGRVGYGPNYNPDPTIEDKITGLKEELRGKVKHDPALVEHGHSVRSGEEKRKKLTGEDETNPFQSARDDEDRSSGPSGPSSPPKAPMPVPQRKTAHESNEKGDKEKGATDGNTWKG